MTEQLKSKLAAIISEDRFGFLPESVIVDKIAEVVDAEQRKPKTGMCVVCGRVPVDVDAGYDTCDSCARTI